MGDYDIAVKSYGKALAEANARAEKAERERERLRAFLSVGEYETIQSEQAWKKRTIAAEALVSELVEAGEPFASARVAEGWGEEWSDNTGLPGLEDLTIGQFRRIRAAIEKAKKEIGG